MNRKLSTIDQKGITLVELLVVMAVIAVLSVIGINSFTRAQRRARDASRKNDLAQIKRALELAKQDGALRGIYYPTSTSSPSWPGFDAAWTPYIIRVPKDPRNVSPYVYQYSLHNDNWTTCSANCPRFRLWARIEDTQDSSAWYTRPKCGLSLLAVPDFYVCSD